jgi:hypothetical protein
MLQKAIDYIIFYNFFLSKIIKIIKVLFLTQCTTHVNCGVNGGKMKKGQQK